MIMHFFHRKHHVPDRTRFHFDLELNDTQPLTVDLHGIIGSILLLYRFSNMQQVS